jgi:hypothetical protein
MSLDISQPYGHPRPITGKVLPFTFYFLMTLGSEIVLPHDFTSRWLREFILKMQTNWQNLPNMSKIYCMRMNQQYKPHIRTSSAPRNFVILIIKYRTNSILNRSIFCDITPCSTQLCLPPAFTLVSCSNYPAALKMEGTCSTETSVDFQWTTRRNIPEDRSLHNHR